MNANCWKSTGIQVRFIQELQKYCEDNYKIEKVILFGSRARGDYHRTSDIDLAVYTIDGSHSEQNLIENSILELPTPLKIDVIFMDRLTKKDMILNILNEGMIIYEQTKVA
jgi:predicted nucleotidyltransferase